MSSLRDNLFSRHRALEPELTRRLHAALAEALPSPAPATPPRAPFLIQLWRELILPARPVWTALAAAWLLLLALHVTAERPHPEQPEIAAHPASAPAHLFLTQHKSIEAFLADRAQTNTHAPAQSNNEPHDSGRSTPPPRDSTSRRQHAPTATA